MALYAQDAWLLPPMESPVAGHANIRPRYETLFSGFNPEIEGHIDDVCISGALGFVRGHYSGRMQGRNGQPPSPVDDVYVMIVKLEGGMMTHALLPASRKSQAIFRSVPELMTVATPNQERRRTPHAKATNQIGISVVRIIRSNANGPPTYWRSMSKRATARGSGVARAGNQNMLEVTATRVSTMPRTLFVYAK
jgi:hypothetical protein